MCNSHIYLFSREGEREIYIYMYMSPTYIIITINCYKYYKKFSNPHMLRWHYSDYNIFPYWIVEATLMQ
jgi:hypothetical protein